VRQWNAWLLNKSSGHESTALCNGAPMIAGGLPGSERRPAAAPGPLQGFFLVAHDGIIRVGRQASPPIAVCLDKPEKLPS
jgi:hypothetical protein